MAKVTFGEYAAFETNGGIRFQNKNKLVSESSVPPEVVSYLRSHLPQPEKPAPRFPRPTPEQIAQLKAESLKVPENLQRTPEEMEAATPLTADDFDAPGEPEPAVMELGNQPPVMNIIEDPSFVPHETKPDPNPPVHPQEAMSDFLEEVSIHTASLEDIAAALYARFGIYTVWLKKLPVQDEVNPLTGSQFTKYHMGIAYQAAIFAQNQGLLDLDPAQGRRAMDEGRAASENFQEQFVPQPVSIKENREANSFDYRTSPIGTRDVPQTQIVHEKGPDGQMHAVQREINGELSETGQKNGAGVTYDRDEDQPLVQPNFTGKPIIRPNW